MASPIWKDYFVDFGDEESVIYRISYPEDGEGRVIFVGKSNKRPGAESNIARINDICADYLANNTPDFFNSHTTFNSFPEFLIEVFNEEEGTWEDFESIRFSPDWSYEEDFDMEEFGMAAPIKSVFDRRQAILFSVFNKTSITYTLQGIRPSTHTIDINGSATITFGHPSILHTGITIDGHHYDYVNTCAEWVVYYINAYGGWDSLIIEGNVSERDDLNRHNISLEYDNGQMQNRGKRNFVNELTKVFTLHTGWLTDDESSRMHHLLNSTNVYLGNLVDGRVFPVVLTNTTTEYKTYKSNGRQLVDYTIEAEVAREMTRK